MKNKSEKRYRKIKKASGVGSLISFVIFSLLTIFVLYEVCVSFLWYIINTKFENEYRVVQQMASLYEEYEKDADMACDIINKFGHDYVITDASGKVIHKNGTDTRGEVSAMAKVTEYSQSALLCEDKNNKTLTINKDNYIDINYKLLKDDLIGEDSPSLAMDIVVDEENGYIYSDDKKYYYDSDGNVFVLNEHGEYKKVEDEEADKYISDSMKNSYILIPLWVGVEMKGGSETLFGKIFFSINMTEFAFLIVLIIMLVIFVIILMISLIKNAIKSIVSQKRLADFFYRDPVTDGHNWMWFQIKGEQMLKKRKNLKNKYAIVNLVFVNYRNYCVCHSIEEGEKLLRVVYRLINSSLEKGEMCAHATSSNFAIILKCAEEDELTDRLNQLISKLEAIESDHKFGFQLGVSIVDRSMDENGRKIRRKNLNIDTEYNNACTARATLDASDDSGIAFFDDELVENQRWIDSVHERQERAVKNEEFLVYYQPKYDPRTNELKGAEALIRWQSPEYGLVSPGRFIPIFEKNGFITEIDHYMISHVARDQKKWLDQGYKCVPVSVNVSRAHFIESDLAEQIRDMVDEAGTPHNLIEIELTESAFFDDKNALVNTINKLKNYGFAVSMDDFGSGYSSLNSLKDMPLDVLKLDAEFFRGDNDDSRGDIVVSEAIRLAKSLNMRTVAEGVEVKEQVDFLAAEGCDMIQGYYFAKPMPGNDYEDAMKNGSV